MKNRSSVLPDRTRRTRISDSRRGLGAVLSESIARLGVLSLPLVLLLASNASAVTDLDRRYALQSVGLLRPFDNLDGILGEPLLAAGRAFFNAPERSNFQWVDLASADSILGASSLPYSKVIDDAELLGQLARKLRTETIVRTKVLKEGPRYRVTLDWLLSPRMQLLASEEFSLEEARGEEDLVVSRLGRAYENALLRLIRKVPFRGAITGRDNEILTVNLGYAAELARGDTLIFGTIDEVKVHPILGSVVDWRVVETGRAVVQDLDEGMAFAKLAAETDGRTVSRYQKVIQVIPVELPVQSAEAGRSSGRSVSRGAVPREAYEGPRLGLLSVGPTVGTFSRDYSSELDGELSARRGSALAMGARASGELWLNPRWFFGANATFLGAGGYSQLDQEGTETLTAGASAQVLDWRAGAGFSFFESTDPRGPRAWLALSYGSVAYDLSVDSAEFLGPVSFQGAQLGIGGDLPLRGNFGANFAADFGLLTQALESGFESGKVKGAGLIRFSVGGYGWIQPRLRVFVGMHATSASISFDTATSLRTGTFSFGPDFHFYF